MSYLVFAILFALLAWVSKLACDFAERVMGCDFILVIFPGCLVIGPVWLLGVLWLWELSRWVGAL